MGRLPLPNNTNVIVVFVELKTGEKSITVKMALDTGATYTIIPWEVAEILELKPELSKEKTEMITASGVESAPLVTIESISAAGSHVKNMEAIVHDLPSKGYVDGLLGLSFLKNFNVKINFKEGFLELS